MLKHIVGVRLFCSVEDHSAPATAGTEKKTEQKENVFILETILERFMTPLGEISFGVIAAGIGYRVAFIFLASCLLSHLQRWLSQR